MKRLFLVVAAWAGCQGVGHAEGPVVDEAGGVVKVRKAGDIAMVWQGSPLESPKGGVKFAGSAFLHELRTPSGFCWTTVQPADHLHHFGLWWPWKFVEVDGKRYNTWEVQEGQGAQVARSVKRLPDRDGVLGWELANEVVVREAGKPERVVIRERVGLALSWPEPDAQMLDLEIHQEAVGGAVKIVDYRYSGFSWRGPLTWKSGNSVMTTSGGKGRDDANGTPARWVMVSGDTPKGKATVLLMSAAVDLAGVEEKLRVWDSKAEGGNPFANFNPVQDAALPLDAAHPAVAKRKYRVMAVDRVLDAAAAEAAWRKWRGK